MITREEMQAVLVKDKRQAAREIKNQAQKTIEYASERIKKGIFHIANGPQHPEVVNLVQKAFKKEGINVTIDKVETVGRTKRNSSYPRQSFTYRFSLAEE